MTDKLHLTEDEWRERLGPEQYQILRQAGTERAFTGKYDQNKADGMYKHRDFLSSREFHYGLQHVLGHFNVDTRSVAEPTFNNDF